jgi:hypothetical protein
MGFNSPAKFQFQNRDVVCAQNFINKYAKNSNTQAKIENSIFQTNFSSYHLYT